MRRQITLAAVLLGCTLLVSASVGMWLRYLNRGGAGAVAASSLPLLPVKSHAANAYVNAHFFDARDIDGIGLGLADYIADAAKPRTQANRGALLRIAHAYSRDSRNLGTPYFGAKRTFGSPDAATLGQAEAELTLGAKTLDGLAVELFAPTAPPPVRAATIARYRSGVAEWNRAVRTIWLEAGISKVDPGWPLIDAAASP